MASSRTAGAAVLRSADEALEYLDGDDRFVDCCIVFRRGLTKEYICEAGGRWDRRLKRWSKDTPATAVHIDVDESQLEVMAAFARWLEQLRAGDQNRDLVIFAGGARGGGKTFICTLLLVAVALELPGCLTWAISPTLDKREEIERTIREWVPASWRRYRGMPDCRFIFPTKSALRSMSEEQLGKRGEAAAIFINEGQDQGEEVFAHSGPPLRKGPGLMIIAANAPDEDNVGGAWTVEAKDGIDEGAVDGTYCDVDPERNSHVSQIAQDKIGRAMYRVVPKIARADVGNEWKYPGRRAFDFKPKAMVVQDDGSLDLENGGHVGDPPDIGCRWLDVTRQETAGKATRRDGYGYVFGVDFGKDPHNAVAIGHVLQRGDGRTLYYWSDELLVPGSENDLAEAMIDWCELRSIDRGDVLIVADGSGKWQKANRDRDGNYSHDILISYGGWTVVPPRKPVNAALAPSGAGRNPHVPDSLAQMGDVLRAGRFLVGSRAPWLAECMKKCAVKRLAGGVELDKGKDRDQFTHITDAVRYPIWFLEPRKKPAPPRTLDEKRRERFRSIRVLTSS